MDVRFQLPTPEAHFPCPPDTALNQLADSLQQPVIFSHKLSPISLSRDSINSRIKTAVCLTHTQFNLLLLSNMSVIFWS